VLAGGTVKFPQTNPGGRFFRVFSEKKKSA
jgi:hypothetical protein